MYLEILGLNGNPSKKQIKKAYRKLAIKHHPDAGGDARLFKRIQEAYENALAGNYSKPKPQTSSRPKPKQTQTNNYNHNKKRQFSHTIPPHLKPIIHEGIKGLIQCDYKKNQQRGRTVYRKIAIDNARDLLISNFSLIVTIKVNNLCFWCHGEGGFKKKCYCVKFHKPDRKCNICNGKGYFFEKCMTCVGEKTKEELVNRRIWFKESPKVDKTYKFENLGENDGYGNYGDLYIKIVDF